MEYFIKVTFVNLHEVTLDNFLSKRQSWLNDSHHARVIANIDCFCIYLSVMKSCRNSHDEESV